MKLRSQWMVVSRMERIGPQVSFPLGFFFPFSVPVCFCCPNIRRFLLLLITTHHHGQGVVIFHMHNCSSFLVGLLFLFWTSFHLVWPITNVCFVLIFIYLYIYFGLCWIFLAAASGLSLGAANGSTFCWRFTGFYYRARALG